jgi:phage N-6-adenine-methyltransferase
MVDRALFSSATDDWETPQFLFDGIDAEFGFDLDVCASETNAKCKRFFTRFEDGLRQNWDGVCWMNPPYGRDIERWMKKAFDAAIAGALVVCLVPVRTDTRWWHRYAMRGEIRYLRGRLRFGNSKNSAPFPSALVIFRPPKCV